MKAAENEPNRCVDRIHISDEKALAGRVVKFVKGAGREPATREKPWRLIHEEEPRLHVEGAVFLLGLVGDPWLYPHVVLSVRCDEPFGFPFPMPERRAASYGTSVVVVRRAITFCRAEEVSR